MTLSCPIYQLALWMVTIGISNSACLAVAQNATKWTAMPDAKLSTTFRIQAPGSPPIDGASKVLFSDKFAISAMHDPKGRYGNNWNDFLLFDLERMAWYNCASKSWIDLKACQEWEKASNERTKASLAKAPNDKARAFVEAMINPRLKLQENQNGTLLIFNDFVSYEITPTKNLTPSLSERFASYDRLNAYHKAMNDRQLPPTTQAVVDDFFAERKIMPSELTVKIKTAAGEVVATTSTRVDSFVATDVELFRQELAKLPQR